MGSDPEKLFPYNLMLEHFRKFARYGLILATVILPVITSEREYGIDLDEIANNAESRSEEDFAYLFISERSRRNLNKRLRDIVVDMVRWEYI